MPLPTVDAPIPGKNPSHTTVAAVTDFMERLAPRALAGDWDNVGLLLGDHESVVHGIMTCLTLTPDVAAEALEESAQVIVTHHPILFRAVKCLTASTPEGRMVIDLIRAGVAVYSPHTAFDNTGGGINDLLAQRIGLTEVRPLRRADGERQCKIVVFVPDPDLSRVSDALFGAGAGLIGQYSQCSFRLAGTGTFFGSDAANPTVGQKGRREDVSEWRLEAVCPERLVDSVVAAMRRAHSYEEPAYDVYPLRSSAGKVGAGRVGALPQTMPLAELAQKTKTGLKAESIQMVGDPNRLVQRVAIACGAGGEFLDDAARQGSDVFLTGEVRFHDFLSARAKGVALLLPGHYATERPGVEQLAERLQIEWPHLKVWASRREREPFIVV
jgi:dinuclear metal center YbgI/SA1388 family protein